jgi:dTDP-glucose pyrophosphorylase
MHIIIPAAGLGSRFINSEFQNHKPLISWNDKPMLQHVVENFLHPNTQITIIKQNKFEFYFPGINILDIDYLTDGPATTASLARHLIDPEEQLIITNCDQIIKDWNHNTFLNFAKSYDGVLGCFISDKPHNSYVNINQENLVIDVKEKVVISNIATNGLHFWQKAKYFFESYDSMRNHKDTTNNEYYVAPSYRYLIDQNYKIGIYMFNQHFPVGTPEQLRRYLDNENR